MEMVKSDDEKLITSCVRISCYNLANRWNIQPCRILLHFLVYCAEGVLSKSIYSSTVINSSDDLYEILKQVVEEVRFKLGLQVITNCDEKCTRRRLAETFPALHWTLRAAHCIGFILEDFVKVEWINTIIEQARFMTRFIYKHGVVLNMVRMYAFDNDTGELAATRSTTNFTTLTHMVDLRNNLQPMVTSHEWIDFPYLQKSRGRNFFFSSSVEKHVFWTDHKRNFSFFITDNALPGIEARKYVIEFVLHCIPCHANKSKGRTKADELVPSEKRITYFCLSLWTTAGNEIDEVYKVAILNRNTPFLLVLFRKKLPQLAETSIERVEKNSYILSNSSYRNNLNEIVLETEFELEIANVYLKL
ncbi:hypothetical protein V6N13_016898 [Hibiscus sabdariffa]|uniref:DUF659 domain-containing protein n=1 Tax=Hibiscus sabdariffa TaxID=183260 RepID=A0ABR2PUP3_9ROSI